METFDVEVTEVVICHEDNKVMSPWPVAYDQWGGAGWPVPSVRQRKVSKGRWRC